MSDKNNVSMPQSTAGLQRFSSDDTGKLRLSPIHVIVFTIIVAVVVLFLHLYGPSLLGL